MLKYIPISLTLTRLLIAPLIVILALVDPPRFIFVILIIVAFLSDWLDGVIARRLGVATVFLRRFDIVADVIFYLSVLFAICLLETTTAWSYAVQFAILLGFEVVSQIFHFARFGSHTATHAYLCKLWAIFLATAAIGVLGFGLSGILLQATFIVGYIAYLDVLLIILLARNEPIDVVSSWHVWRERG